MEHHGTSWQTSPPAVTLPPSPPITPPGNYLDLSPTSSAPSSAPASAFPSPSLLTPASFGALPPPPPLLRRSSSDLFEAVERHRHFSEHHARHIFVQILAAVCDLARTGIIHRDLKDENITLAEDTLQVSRRRPHCLDRQDYRSFEANPPPRTCCDVRRSSLSILVRASCSTRKDPLRYRLAVRSTTLALLARISRQI